MNKTSRRLTKRTVYALRAIALAILGLLPVFTMHAAAYNQLLHRSIRLSSSLVGTVTTGNNAGNSVSYLVTFDATTNAKNVRIDFCSNSPIYTDTCTAPAGMNAASATFANGTGFSGFAIATGNNTVAQANTGANFVTINSASAMTATTAMSYTLSGIVNPSGLGTFYARINTYAAQSNDWASAANPGTIADFGGIALATVNSINITAKVQETLTFCVSGLDLSPSSDCTSATNPNSLVIGHGTPKTIDQSAVDTADAYTQVSTNASSGVSMRVRTNNTCTNGGLSSNGGTTCNIPGVAGGAPVGSTAQAIVAGTAAFGLYLANSTTSTTVSPAVTGTGTVTPDANYHNASHVTIPTDLWYGMDQDATNGVVSTYGDVIATSTGPLSLVNNHLVFGATASLTTPAGIYTANEDILTTGTF